MEKSEDIKEPSKDIEVPEPEEEKKVVSNEERPAEKVSLSSNLMKENLEELLK